MSEQRSSDAQSRVVSGIPVIRASLTEIVLLTLAVALGVNLISTTLSTWFPGWLTLTLGVAFGLIPIIYVARNRLKAVVHETEIEGFIVYDKETNALIEVPDYKLAEDAVRYLSAAFSENPALRHQWESEPPMKDLTKASKGKANLGERLLNELIEYIVIDRLSMTLGDHFNRSGISKDKLRTYSRSDLPDILLKNRFLELFSRDLADRAGFTDQPSESDDGWTLVSTNNSAGGYYHRFELTLPSNSAIKRASNGDLLIEGPNLTARISARVPGYGGSAPFSLSRLYLGVSGWDIHDLLVDVSVQVTVKRQWLLGKEAIRYNVWIEDVLEHLVDSLSGQRFVERIQWPMLEAAVQVFDRESRGQRVRTTKAETSEGSDDAEVKVSKRVGSSE